MKTKGISLPIEMVIIIAISVIVLLAIVAFFFSGLFGPKTRLNDATAWQSGCAMIKARGCGDMDLSTMSISMWYPYTDTPTVEGTVRDACRINLGIIEDDAMCISSCCSETSIPRTNPEGGGGEELIPTPE